MKRIKICIFFLLQITLAYSQKNFSFVYLPDIHLQPGSDDTTRFDTVVKKVNKLHPDFVLTGGDMIYTAKNVNDIKADRLFDLMDRQFKKFKMPVYFTMGNHENVGITEESGIDKTNTNWGKQMYERRYSKRYYSFVYDGWKFFILDGLQILEEKHDYTQGIDSIQIEWIKEELGSTEKTMPIVISVHPPFINPHAMTDSGSKALSKNSEIVMSLFKDHNLRMVLQAHNHIYMSLFINGIHYISGGSTAFGTDRINDGFIIVTIKNNTEYFKFISAGS